MTSDKRKPGAVTQGQGGQAEQVPDAVSSLVSIMEQQKAKSPELAAKQARLMALLKAETPPPVDSVPKVWADVDLNRPETEEDGIRARAQQIGQWKHQAQQQRARAEAADPTSPRGDSTGQLSG